MLQPSEILTKLQIILAEQLACKESQVTPAARFKADLGADSLDHVEIIMAVEDEFGLNISDDDAERIQTVQQAIDYLLGKV